MSKLNLMLSRAVYSQGDLLQGIIQINNTAPTTQTFKSFAIRFVSKLIANKNFIECSKIPGFDTSKREIILYTTNKTIFASSLVIPKNSCSLYHFSLKLPFKLPNSVRNQFYRFVNAVEVFYEENSYTRIYRVPFCVISRSSSRIETLEVQKVVYFKSIQELSLKKPFGLKSDEINASLLHRINFEQEPHFAINPGYKNEKRTFSILADHTIISNIEVLKSFFYLDEKIRFKISVIKPCKLTARLYCVYDVNEKLKPKKLSPNLAVLKELKAEKFVDLTSVNWSTVELFAEGDNIPTAYNPIGSVQWWIKFTVTLDGGSQDKQYFCICIVPVYKSRKKTKTIVLNYDLKNE
eukprot:GAHX01001512.1.p1 GENE.GAHX01001512.1~~GAHX01001512.1.p1  ORF type:complete len:351 (-),score=46.51 GAHX01001512.1:46-1098(-)